FNASLTEVSIKVDDSIVMYADEATEAQSPDGQYFGDDRFLNAVLSSGSFQVIDNVLKQVNLFSGDSSQSDDVSLIEYIITSD
ncbi:MAG: SpoIIE family protein phosphatase, partial [Gammaproteobacteria bacterium]|nr:SpoIIE family protein phosphatase [Gammaproteobacteria bacterium]